MIGTLEITTVVHCVNVCTYCPQDLLKAKYNHPTKRMSLEMFIQCINKVPKNIIIDFAGYAEPFLNQQAPEMIEYAINNGYQVRLFTTLVGLTKEGLDKIKKFSFRSVVLHLPDDDGYLKCNVDDAYCEIATLFKQSIPINDSHVYGKLHNRLTSIFTNVETKKLTNQHLHTRANNVKTDKIELKSQEYMSGDIGCDVIRRKGGTELNHNILLPNGDVTICCMDYGLEHKIGNLSTDEYEDLFKSEGYNYVINGMKKDANYDILCRTCKEAYQK